MTDYPNSFHNRLARVEEDRAELRDLRDYVGRLVARIDILEVLTADKRAKLPPPPPKKPRLAAYPPLPPNTRFNAGTRARMVKKAREFPRRDMPALPCGSCDILTCTYQTPKCAHAKKVKWV